MMVFYDDYYVDYYVDYDVGVMTGTVRKNVCLLLAARRLDMAELIQDMRRM